MVESDRTPPRHLTQLSGPCIPELAAGRLGFQCS